MNKHDYGGDGSTEHQHAFRFVIWLKGIYVVVWFEWRSDNHDDTGFLGVVLTSGNLVRFW